MTIFLTYEELAEEMRKLGIHFGEHVDVISAIKYHGYNKIITDYVKILAKKEGNISFEIIESLVLFDFDLQSLLFKYIIQTESTLKTLFSHKIGNKLGIKNSEYFNASNYENSKSIEKQINFISKKFVQRNSFEKAPFSKYKSKDDIPPWVYFSQVNLGDFIYFYSNIDIDIKYSIANDLISDRRPLLIGDKNELVSSSLKFMHSFRNNIAHGQHCLNFSTDKNIKFDIISKLITSDVLSREEYKYNKKRIFMLFILTIILNPYSLIRNNFLEDLNSLYDSYHNKLGNDFIGYFHEVSNVPTDFKFRLSTLNSILW
ncbi:Abi family protein [Staphylococcus rostri]